MDDNAIIELFFARSEQAIRELDGKYGKVCHSLSYNILHSRQDAEECVNDAYLGTWDAIPPARPNPLLAFLCQIVRNLSLMRYHADRAAKRGGGSYTVAPEELEDCLASPRTVEGDMEEQELVRLIEDFLETLSLENRVILMRRYWFSDSCGEIAERAGLSEKNVSVRLTRIRKQLRHYFEERGVM
ncbi:MAG: sigma-70 family RNA polymerase sigma factor [Oscillibacter sp.]|uniref:RNA polymerase sigma factor n=1 Tax=Oscillibacter sp. TaxID=1945593 RepID=UPI0021733F23|nr:sigma-70 family RNA polymerase sigma factor [Oscillibacter sp.]MCI9114507.1 sigma-70 family RNA polymerase sigma factor [Oscillibacter sp.]